MVLAGDTLPIEVYCHLPVMCEDRNLPYVYIPSKTVRNTCPPPPLPDLGHNWRGSGIRLVQTGHSGEMQALETDVNGSFVLLVPGSVSFLETGNPHPHGPWE